VEETKKKKAIPFLKLFHPNKVVHTALEKKKKEKNILQI